mmetsp:Transcript_28569/g.53102  ORF Transcript_28569/g.53102 Transcript_28569/m.53102 type:complete len:83 (+) Transcript_28569:528-776(+)
MLRYSEKPTVVEIWSEKGRLFCPAAVRVGGEEDAALQGWASHSLVEGQMCGLARCVACSPFEYTVEGIKNCPHLLLLLLLCA